jgi:hypothetical protein
MAFYVGPVILHPARVTVSIMSCRSNAAAMTPLQHAMADGARSEDQGPHGEELSALITPLIKAIL